MPGPCGRAIRDRLRERRGPCNGQRDIELGGKSINAFSNATGIGVSAASRRDMAWLLTGLVWLGAPAHAASFQANTLFNADNRRVWGNTPAFVLDTGPRLVGLGWNEGARAGGVECALFA